MPISNSPETEILVTADCWQSESGAEAAIHRAIEMAAAMVDAETFDAELAIMLTDDDGIRTLNKNWRGKMKSVPAAPGSSPALDLITRRR